MLKAVRAVSFAVALICVAGAFPLPANSLDSVVQVALQPGAYSAQVTGVGGTAGAALVEVYEVP